MFPVETKQENTVNVMKKGIEKVTKASLFFIIPINRLLEIDNLSSEEEFLNLLNFVQQDEYKEEFCKEVDRRLFYKGSITYRKYLIDARIYINNFNLYESSSVYINLVLEDDEFEIEDFANLISGKNIIEHCYIKGQQLKSYMKLYHIDVTETDDIFLFNQIIETFPEFPKDYEQCLDFIKENKQNIHQLLMRSDTHHQHLRLDNHQANFESIANFYGTVDLCSPVTLIQIYLHPITSIADKSMIIDVEHRACWWLTITDVIFIQNITLKKVLKSINSIQNDHKKNVVRKLSELETILFTMRGFWYFEDMSHEITKKVVNKVKERVGVERLLDNVQMRIASIENSALREINEEQNHQNNILNFILLVITGMQVVPLVYQVINFFYDPNKNFTMEQIMIWAQTFSIVLLIPLLIWKGRLSRNRLNTSQKRNQLFK